MNTAMNTAMLDRAERASRSSIMLAIILIVLGVLAIALPMFTSVGVVKILAALIILNGLAQLVHAFQAESAGRTTWKILVAILYLGVGIYLFANPLVGLAGLTLLLAMFFFAEGFMDIVTYFMTRSVGGSGWLLLHGLVTVALGLMIWTRWPLSSLWLIGTLVGISMVLTGVTRLMMALEIRKIAAARDSRLAA
jgi:uncharacterized membrane protein HdeD (DUF308 family)